MHVLHDRNPGSQQPDPGHERDSTLVRVDDLISIAANGPSDPLGIAEVSRQRAARDLPGVSPNRVIQVAPQSTPVSGRDSDQHSCPLHGVRQCNDDLLDSPHLERVVDQEHS